MLDAIRQKLLAEVEALNHELHVALPEALQKARELGDLRENGDFIAAIERQRFIQARLNQLRERLGRLSQIDLTKIPRDRVGLGSRVTVTDLDTKTQEVWELVIPDAMDVDAGQISVSSPLGRALLDRKRNDEVTVQLPIGTRRLRIDELITFHRQLAE
jgi:transcription elongation factor GreA